MGLWLKQDDGELVPVSGGSTGADGKGWTGGTYDPATGTVTFTSDDGLEFTTGDLRGTDGIDGLDGNMWHVGSGDPASTLGDPGDYYLDGEAGWVWVKRTDTSWTNLYVNLTGPPGADGDGGGSHDHDYLPLSGGTVTGDLTVDGNSDLQINVPADYWSNDSGTVFSSLGMLGGTQGSYATSMTSNGYRNTSGKWTSLALNGSPGAVQISLLPTGIFEVRTKGNYPTGSASNPPLRLTIDDVKTKVLGNLQVDGSATVGGQAVSVSGHTHDKVGGLGLAGVAVPPSGAQIVRSGTNGYTYLGWLNTVSGATTGTPTRIYTNSGGSDSFVRYMTPANFRAKVTDGSYSATGHGHSGYLLLSGGSMRGQITFEYGNGATFYDGGNRDVATINMGNASNGTSALVLRSHSPAVELQASGAKRALYAATNGLWAPGVYAAATATGNHVRVTNANGGIQRSTNSRAHLKQIEPARRAAVNSVLDLEPVWYRSNCEGDNPDLSFYGFISEDVAEVDERFVNFTENEDGVLEPGDINYGAITALLVSVVKEQRGQIAELTARLDKMEGMMQEREDPVQNNE